MKSLLSWPIVWSLAALAVLAVPCAAEQGTESQIDRTVLESPDPDLPAFDQEAILAEQRARLEPIRQKVNVKAYAAESDHFLLIADLDVRVRGAILRWLEELRDKTISHLRLPAGARLWDGKCVVVVFAEHDSLVTYAKLFDDHSVGRSRGYFVMEARRGDEPRLVHIATFQPLRGGHEALREVLVHETTHAIIQLYRKSTRLPLWVNEGLAEYMTVAMDANLQESKQSRSYQRASANPYVPLGDFWTREFPASDLEGYSLSFSLVQCLLDIDPDGVMNFVVLLKAGMEPEQALGEAYRGMTYSELERRWKIFCLKRYIPRDDRNRRP
ncbi:MAG: hypothetical protein JXL80_02250 [Planctomycetes bacterium]|nr:hypothetical protein [Planctomycetota bacterium]